MSSRDPRRSSLQPPVSPDPAKQPTQYIAPVRDSRSHTAASPSRLSVYSESVKRSRQSHSPGAGNREHPIGTLPTGRPLGPSPMQPPIQPPMQPPIQPPIQLPAQGPVQSSIQARNQVPMHQLPPSDIPSARTNPNNAVQALGQTRAGGRDVHVSTPGAAHRSVGNSPRPCLERHPRRELLLSQETDALLALANAEKDLFALNAYKQKLDPQRVVDGFEEIWAKITRCRNRLQEIRLELAGSGGPRTPASRVG